MDYSKSWVIWVRGFVMRGPRGLGRGLVRLLGQVGQVLVDFVEEGFSIDSRCISGSSILIIDYLTGKGDLWYVGVVAVIFREQVH